MRQTKPNWWPGEAYEKYVQKQKAAELSRKAKIESALSFAKDRGVQIVRGPCFDWVGSDGVTPTACNQVGAMLLQAGDVNGSWPLVMKLLNVRTFWMYCWHIGWGQQRILYDADRPIPETVDAMRMSRKWTS